MRTGRAGRRHIENGAQREGGINQHQHHGREHEQVAPRVIEQVVSSEGEARDEYQIAHDHDGLVL